jgi:TonB family protein
VLSLVLDNQSGKWHHAGGTLISKPVISHILEREQMTRVWIHLAAMAILSQVIALAQQGGSVFTDTLAFENGSIANSVYSNECLGFSFVIPTGWQLSTQVVGTDVKATHNSRLSLILLTIDQQQGESFNSRVSLNAYDPYAPTVRQFVSSAAHGAVSVDPKNGEMVKDAYAVDYGGRHFFRADYKRTTSEGTLYMAFVFTKFREYYIGEVVMSKSPEGLDLAVSSLQQISFGDDEPNLRCVMSGADSPDSGTAPSLRPSLSRSPNLDPLPVPVSQGVSSGLVTRKVTPQYPEIALNGRVQGQVVMRAVIDKNGDIEELAPISGSPILAAAALEAVKQWKYRPYVFNGQPVRIETQITVVFECACIQTWPASGRVGASVTILGNHLSGTTSIAFNGTPATFTVISSTQIKTTVPSGATSGPVQVSGPGGTFSSNIVFRLRP